MAITKAKLSYVDGITSSTAELNLLSGLSGVVEATADDGSSIIPSGNTSQRDVSPVAGYLRFNTEDASFEGYDGSAWGAIGGGGINNQKLDDISSGFNSSDTSFSLAVSSVAVEPGSVNNVLISLNGVIQEPTTTYTISGSTITFTTAPDSGDTFFGLYYGSLSINVPADGSVGTDQLSSANIAFDTSTLFIDSTNDRVGIGTITPDGALDVTGANGGNGEIYVQRTSGATLRTQAQSALGVFGTTTNHNLTFITNSGGRMTIDTSGRVGIGETSISGYNSYGDGLIVKKSTIAGSSGITVQAPSNTGYSSLYFGDPDDTKVGWVEYSHTADSLTFAAGNATAMLIDSSGKVGIGTTSPETTLEVKSTGSSIAGLNTHVLLSDETAMATNVGGGILFEGNYTTGGDDAVFAGIKSLKENGTSGNYAGALAFYSRADGSLPAERMRIDSSGNLLVGTTDSNPVANNVDSGVQLGDGRIRASRVDRAVLELNRKTSDGGILELRKDGATVGSIGSLTSGRDLHVNSTGGILTLESNFSSTERQIVFGNTYFGPRSTDNNAVDLGRSVSQFKDLYLSGGVFLGGTGSANLLDDYEEGDIDISTMYFEYSGSAITNTAYDTLRYVKIGSQVTITGNIYFDSVTSQNGALKIPLPFANGTGQKFRTVGIIGNFQSNTTTVVKIDSGQSFGLLVNPYLWSGVTVAAAQTYVVNVTYNT